MGKIILPLVASVVAVFIAAAKGCGKCILIHHQ
jgi:AhpD family alkylhydroperoxidase